MVQKMLTRLELNKEVRRIFVRHGIDTSKIQFSCQSRSLSLTGALFKEGGQEVEIHVVEIVVQELGRLGIRVGGCELENWNIMEGTISRKGSRAIEESQLKVISISYSETQTQTYLNNIIIKDDEDSEDES